MKTIIAYLVLSLSIAFVSCDILDVEPTTSWSGTDFPTEETHLNGILYAGYERLQTALDVEFLVYGEIRSEVFYVNAFNVNIDKVVNNKLDYGMSLASWRTFYEAIKQANIVLKFTPELLAEGKMTEANANLLMGQAYCMRAFTYFYIARIWGEAPLITVSFLSNEDLVDVAREPLPDMFKQIHQDLEEAARLIPSSNISKTTFTQTAAWAIDAHVYAWEHNYEKVIERCDLVLSNTNYSLASLFSTGIDVSAKDFKVQVQASEFAGIFNAGRSKESIFELAFGISDGDDSKYLSSYLSGSYPYVRPNNPYAESFDDADWRAVVAHERASNGKYKVTKFTINFSSDTDTRNIVLLRLADIYLLKAEAVANLDDSDENRILAMNLVNMIRNRAGGEDFKIPADVYLDRENFTQDDLKDMIQEERKFELCYEGYRWFDLIRCGKVFEIMKERAGIELNPLSLVWPISLDEIRRSKLIDQNEYYK
ncbi:MAG: RagB/SusD family nutrient uptake outer membrane protein [Mangrovibacterium sp.]